VYCSAWHKRIHPAAEAGPWEVLSTAYCLEECQTTKKRSFFLQIILVSSTDKTYKYARWLRKNSAYLQSWHGQWSVDLVLTDNKLITVQGTDCVEGGSRLVKQNSFQEITQELVELSEGDVGAAELCSVRPSPWLTTVGWWVRNKLVRKLHFSHGF
jgi:hypothetical protein